MNTKNRTISGILAMIIVLAVSAGCLFGCGGSGYKDAAESFMEAYKKLDAEKIVNLMPEVYVEKMAETLYDGSKEELVAGFQDLLEGTKDVADEQGYEWSKLEYKLGEFKDVSVDELDVMKKTMEAVDLEVKDAKSVEIKITYPPKDKDGKEEKETEELYLIQVGASWYVLMDM